MVVLNFLIEALTYLFIAFVVIAAWVALIGFARAFGKVQPPKGKGKEDYVDHDGWKDGASWYVGSQGYDSDGGD
ncbi:MAG: hypothetical protein HDS38_08980 [Bacteroides sp.]|nr:hypothetical protein [Bacteroides sp.]